VIKEGDLKIKMESEMVESWWTKKDKSNQSRARKLGARFV